MLAVALEIHATGFTGRSGGQGTAAPWRLRNSGIQPATGLVSAFNLLCGQKGFAKASVKS